MNSFLSTNPLLFLSRFLLFKDFFLNNYILTKKNLKSVISYLTPNKPFLTSWPLITDNNLVGGYLWSSNTGLTLGWIPDPIIAILDENSS